MKGQWIKELALRFLKKMPFLKRVKDQKLLKYLPKMELVEKKQGDIIFVEECVVLVLNGRAILREHESNSLDHKIIAEYTKGGIIGFESGDCGISKISNVWTICASESL